jgi:hypothetical protein
MTPEQKAALADMLKALAPNELRVIQYEAKGGHSCKNSSNLITCCDVSRCEACHIPHLKAVHGEAKVHAFQRFYRAGTMTWPGQVVTKENKKPKSELRAPIAKHFNDPQDLADRINDGDLERVLLMLQAKLIRRS